eukprot:2402769-Rhodomonas_salina.3
MTPRWYQRIPRLNTRIPRVRTREYPESVPEIPYQRRPSVSPGESRKSIPDNPESQYRSGYYYTLSVSTGREPVLASVPEKQSVSTCTGMQSARASIWRTVRQT